MERPAVYLSILTQLPFQDAARQGRVSTQIRNSIGTSYPRLGPRGKRLPQSTTRGVPSPDLIQSPVISGPLSCYFLPLTYRSVIATWGKTAVGC
jgi:hypothetical protein